MTDTIHTSPKRDPLIREMTIHDHDGLLRLLAQTPGVSLREADSREATARYLERNPGLSFVAVAGADVVGCAMSGHDGRRGYLQHVVVGPAYRRQGIGRALTSACIEALLEAGIEKTHLFVFRANEEGNRFWRHAGWQLREDINMYSLVSSDNDNA